MLGPSDRLGQGRKAIPPKRSAIANTLSMPSQWLHMYDEFITKNAHQVQQIESTLRSLTYIIPGRFRDAEIASESIHSGVQLLSLYHDTLLRRAHTLSKQRQHDLPSLSRSLSPHSRYTRFWTLKSAFYRRVAYLLQIVSYVELLCEMAAKRRGERTRWRVVILIEAVKAFCKLLLLRITKSRPLVTPVLPEREPVPEPSPDDADEDEDRSELASSLEGEDYDEERHRREGAANGAIVTHTADGSAAPPPKARNSQQSQPGPDGEWTMPRTGMTLPPLPAPGDTSGYLLSRVLTADDIKPAAKLVNQLRGTAQHAAEVLHILAPLVFAVAMARSRLGSNRGKSDSSGGGGAQAAAASWTPWLLGVGVELAARRLRDGKSLRTTPLEREEWGRRAWAMGWWAMRGAFYENVTKGWVEGVRKRMPGLLAGILEDYEYLWEGYYFSTSP